MPEPKPPREHHIPLFGLFLLFLGIVLLLQTFQVLPWNLWGVLWRFWPVLIIIIGLDILLRRYNPWLVSALALVLLSGCLSLAIWQYGQLQEPEKITQSYSQPLGSLERAKVEIDLTLGRLAIYSLPVSSPNLVEISSQMPNDDLRLRADFSKQGSEGKLRLSTERINRQRETETRWEVYFTQKIPLTIEVKSATSSLNLDLSKINVTQLEMDLDVGDYEVKMPSSAGTTKVYIKADLANLEITVPQGVAIKLRADTDLTVFDVNERRFPREGSYYISQDFENAENQIEVELDCDLSRVVIK